MLPTGSAANSAMIATTVSGWVIWGVWPAFSMTTNRAESEAAARVSACERGTMRSSSPIVINAGRSKSARRVLASTYASHAVRSLKIDSTASGDVES